MSDEQRLLHIYAQPSWHDDAVIVGNRAGLEALMRAVHQALGFGQSGTTAEVADGEGFEVKVRLDDAQWQSLSWLNRAVPYTDEAASEHRHNVVWPNEEE